MAKSATDIMQDVLFSAVVDAMVALKESGRGLPNAVLRDLNAVHPNTTFADLPPAVQAAVTGSVRAAFARLQKEGYAVSQAGSTPFPPRPPRSPRHAGGAAGPEPRGRPRPPAGKGRPPGPR